MSSHHPAAALLGAARVAIVGVSADPAKHGSRVLANLKRFGFEGTVWGVNPAVPTIAGTSVYATLADLPAPPDIVVCAVPARGVTEVVHQSGEAGARAVVIFAGGFAEAGSDGAAVQADLAAAARVAGVRLLGPNSGGVIRPHSGLTLSFLTCLDRPAQELRAGPVGLVTQSGGTGSYLHNLAAARGGGLGVSISTGNEADLDVADGILALCDLDDIAAIAVVLEAVRDGPKFLEALRTARRFGKPVVVTPIGTSSTGRRLMRTHTGALAGSARVLAGVLDAEGAVVAETPEEMLEIAGILAVALLPAGNRFGVVTHSGGVAILLADLAERYGVELTNPGEALSGTLQPLLDHGTAANPLDMGAIMGGPHRFSEIVEAFAASDDYDGVLAVSTAHPPSHTAARTAALLDYRESKPIIHLWMAGDLGADGLRALREAGRPVTEQPRAAMRAVAGLNRLAGLAASQSPASHSELAAVPDAEGEPPVATAATEHEAKRLLADWGLPVVRGHVARSAAEAAGIADSLGYPVVVKVSSPDIAHKSRVGGVLAGIEARDAVQRAYRKVTESARRTHPQADIQGVLVEEYRPGPEVIVGALLDDTFGPVVLVGVGGALTEVVGEVALAPAPVAEAGAARMIARVAKIAALYGTAIDTDTLADIISLLSRRFVAGGRLAEIEINPLVWTDRGWVVVDALARLT